VTELRAAGPDDVSAIVAINPHSPYEASEILALVREQASLVAEDSGEVVGFVVVRPGHFYQRDFVDLLLVVPGHRRRGLGRELLRAALRNAASDRVFVSTNESNTPMRELLRREGWRPSGVLDGLDPGDPEHVFFHDTERDLSCSGDNSGLR
jgi:GNAT superfamily N-acetyltransferase